MGLAADDVDEITSKSDTEGWTDGMGGSGWCQRYRCNQCGCEFVKDIQTTTVEKIEVEEHGKLRRASRPP